MIAGFRIGTDKGPVKIDCNLANLPAFGDQRQVGQPRAGVADVVGFYFGNKKVTRVSNTKLGMAPEFTVVFHELAEAFQKIDNGKGNSYEAGHNAANEQEKILRDQRPYLKDYNAGITVALCSSDWSTVLASTQTDARGFSPWRLLRRVASSTYACRRPV
jgi:hypothetical protein